MNEFRLFAHGEHFDPDAFLASRPLVFDGVWHKGEQCHDQPKTSGVYKVLGNGHELSLSEQETIAVAYLSANRKALKTLAQVRDVTTFILGLHYNHRISPQTVGFCMGLSEELMWHCLDIGISPTIYVSVNRGREQDNEVVPEPANDSDYLRQLGAFRAAHNLESAHWIVLSYLLVEPPRPAVKAASNARNWAKATCEPIQTVPEYQEAILDMIDRDLVWEIDARKQSLISEYLDADPAHGPTSGLPEAGTLQISIRMAQLLDDFWAGVKRQRSTVLCSSDWQTDRLQIVYGLTRQHCWNYLRDELCNGVDEIEYVAGPNPCGPWRCDWWHKNETGFVLEMKYV